NPEGDCAEKGDAGDACTFNDADEPMPNDEDAGCKPGLKCDPNEEICVANCQLDYPCTVNTECPQDHACVPIDVGDDSSSWKACRPIGTAATDRCDEDSDCVESRRCDDGVCNADYVIGGPPAADTCNRDAQCEAGSFCDLATTSALNAIRVPT